MENDAFKNGLIGEISEDIYLYCNEKDFKEGFILKCGEGCKHNPPKEK